MKSTQQSAEEAVRDIRRALRRQYSAEERIRIVLEGLWGEDFSVAMRCF
jgi:transposase